MHQTDDSALLRQYVENNSDEVFAALVTRHINLVYSVAMRSVGNPASAEEITQAVFIILARKAGQLRNVNALSSWLFQTTRLTAHSFLRTEMRRQRREHEAHDMQTILNEPEPELWPRIAPLLDGAVAALNEKDRHAILLRFYEGKNLREIGTVLGASEAAAEKRVSRALEKLRKFFTKRGVDSTTAVIAEQISVHSIQAAPVVLAKSVTAVAIAKGAAASTSTLALAKGALKIMAWAKAKTAIAISAGILLVAGTTTMTIREIEAHGTLTMRVHVDGGDVIKVSGNQLWIEHDTYLLPENPIYVNGTPWSPKWTGNVSSKFEGLGRKFKPRDSQKIKLSVIAGRGTVSIEELPAPANDETLSVFIDDRDDAGTDWYEFTISW